MDNQTTLQKIIYFPLTKMVVGILVVAGCVALCEWSRNLFPNNSPLTIETKNFIIGIIESEIAVLSYIFLFRFYEKRQIKELSLSGFWKNATLGFLTAMILQSLIIFVIYLYGGYTIIHINPISFLLPGFTAAITAGFVAEILIRGIVFRLLEEKLGTVIALIISALLFGIAHAGGEGATFFSVLATIIQAGILLSAVYVFTRSLWFPIFFHFAWDFAEPSIYGGINPGISIDKNLFNSKITGPELLTGAQFGPGNSIQSTIFCLIAAILFLWLAKRKNNFIAPYWRQKQG